MGHMEGREGIASDPGRSRIHQLTVKILNEGFARARRHWHRCLGSPSCFGVSLGRSRLWSEVSHQDEREVRGQQAPQARHILSQSGDLNRCRVLKWGHQELGYISYWSHNIWDTGSSFSSVQFSCSVVSDSLQPHESQHTRPPCPSPTPGVNSNSCPSSQ